MMKLCKHEDCAKQSTHIYEKKDACYTKVKSRYDVWPSAYASGALVKCRKVGAKNWGNSKKESVDEGLLKEDIEDLKKIVKELEGASKMHAGQAKRIKAHLDDMNVGESVEEPVEEAYDIWTEDGSFGGTFTGLIEAEYQGRKVKLGKPMQGDAKKFKVYVKNPKGNTVKVNFGQGGDAKGGTMRIRKSNPNARKNFRARHNCDSPGPRHKARYWSCRKW